MDQHTNKQNDHTHFEIAMMNENSPYDKPLKQSYQVAPNVYAGEYPGDKNGETAKDKLARMHAFGIRYFIDLTEDGELVPYRNLLPPDTKYERFPIPDVSVPNNTRSARRIVDCIAEYAQRNKGGVYVHCWGGVGRTGTIVACYLAEQMESPDYPTVMNELRSRFAQMPKSAHRVTPETKEQEWFIRQYAGEARERHALLARVKDCIRGSLMAGAAGDALGYTVEFMRLNQIRAQFGEPGITQFELNADGKALISDDTQMTLFTANGLLMGLTRCCMRGVGADLAMYVDGAYIDWYYTQTGMLKPHHTLEDYHYTWLRDLPELAHRRAPGNTCMEACERMLHHMQPENHSKGCGGIMRVAPMGLMAAAFEVQHDRALYDPDKLAEQGAIIAKTTHLHPLGYLPAALMTLLIARLVPLTPEEAKEQIVSILHEALEVMMRMNEPAKDKECLQSITLNAIRLAQSGISDDEAIRIIGEGWTGEEAWAVSVYSAIRHIDSMRDAIIAAVNHDGDSDSTGSITGNIMGAIYGYEAIRRERLFCPQRKTIEDTIELADIILALADDLYSGCIISEYGPIDTPEKKQWFARYVDMKPRPFDEPDPVPCMYGPPPDRLRIDDADSESDEQPSDTASKRWRVLDFLFRKKK